MSEYRVIEGDCLEVLAGLPGESVQTCITSPPYWGLRDYGAEGQLGLEPTPDQYVANMVRVFREVRRALRDDGTLWLNLGDSYARTGGVQGGGNRELLHLEGKQRRMTSIPPQSGLKEKDLVGVPWRVAFALQQDGWYLRSDIIWAKPNPMPESVTDRPTKAHEYLFLLSKSARYYYDADAVREDNAESAIERRGLVLRPNDRDAAMVAANARTNGGMHDHGRHGPRAESEYGVGGRNKRSVWTVATQPFPGAHFATFPPKLIEPCVLAGAPVGGVVLDPFSGASTTGVVATRHDRNYVGIEINPIYAQMGRERIHDDGPLLNVEIAA